MNTTSKTSTNLPTTNHIESRNTILLVNLGTPKKPTYFATMRFLREFLSDPRVINISKWIWYPILYGFILPFRSQSAKKKYQKIHSESGMPLMAISQKLHRQVKSKIEAKIPHTQVQLAMRYGEQSIASVLSTIKKIPHQNLVILPLFPQYSATTTGSIFDEAARCLQNWNFLPNYIFIRDYCNHDGYINALVTSIHTHWQNHGRGEKLLFSYHGLPEANLANGDPYSCFCHKTTRLVCEKLKLEPNQYTTVFQSRFGPSRWLQPYTEETVKQLAIAGIKKIDIIAPSFAVDCLETIDEITREYEEVFIEHGGQSLQYIPALNDDNKAVEVLSQIIETALCMTNK